MKTLGGRIALYRNSHRWTQEKLASEIGITQGLLSDIENDKVSPRWDMISKIAKVLEVHVLNLLPIELNLLYEEFIDDSTQPPSLAYQKQRPSIHSTQERKLWEALLKAKDETIETLKRELDYSKLQHF